MTVPYSLNLVLIYGDIPFTIHNEWETLLHNNRVDHKVR